VLWTWIDLINNEDQFNLNLKNVREVTQICQK
jgi:hypothetical protein